MQVATKPETVLTAKIIEQAWPDALQDEHDDQLDKVQDCATSLLPPTPHEI